MTPAAEPPRLARRLLARALPEDAREYVDGDLHEVYARRCARDGVPRARLWYWVEALSFAARFLFERLVVERLRSRVSSAGSRRGGIAPSVLDVRLALRMLVKHPALSIVSVTGMAVAIAIGAGVFSLGAALLETTLPLPAGDRVVALQNALVTNASRTEASLRDFVAWRDELTSVQDVSAFTTVDRTLAVPGAGVDLVPVTRMTASGFRVARTAPVLGRPLLEDDERSDARVVVIAFEEWQRRFAADPGVIGRHVGLGRDTYTIVGVMPEGFGFPVADRFWVPLHFGPAERERPDAVPLTIFGRLADGTTVERAQAELGAIGSRMAVAHPATREQLRPRVLSYTRAFFDFDGPDTVWTLQLFRFFVSLLLVVVAVNVAILVYARTATRAGEIAVRTALGASRARVVAQLFVEALVLSLAAALVGLAIAGGLLVKVQALAETYERRLGAVPFWIDLGLSPAVVAYALGLAVVGAAIVGVIPALQATGRRVQANLQQFSGHGARMQLGRAWTALIVAQVAVTVAVLPFAVHSAQEAIADGTVDAGYPAAEFLEASLTIERVDGPQDTSAVHRREIEQRFHTRAAELLRRIESDPAVAGLTIRLPDRRERIEVENGASPGAAQARISAGRGRIHPVAADFFALYDMPIVAGRAFVEADARAGETVLVVNEVLAESWFGNSAVLGRRIRFLSESDTPGEVAPGPWLEIVGVVRDPAGHAHEPQGRFYLPAHVAELSPPLGLAIRVRTSPATSFVPRLRELAATVDPVLQLDGLMGADERHRQGQQFPRFIGIGMTAAMLSVLLLSAAGIYAMMAFTVARRRREIGIRSALGADPRRVLSSIFARASTQIGAGIVLGVIGTVIVDRATGRGPVHDGNPFALLLVAVLMTTIGLLAAIGPARRGLAVQPTEALREE